MFWQQNIGLPLLWNKKKSMNILQNRTPRVMCSVTCSNMFHHNSITISQIKYYAGYFIIRPHTEIENAVLNYVIKIYSTWHTLQQMKEF
jgi:hypothetical protein